MLCLWVLREINSRFCSKTQWQMFLLISGRHVGAHLGEHQHGGSIQISINLGKTFLLISSVRKIAVTWFLARVFAYLLSFYFQILDFLDWRFLFFILIYCEWRDTENQQYDQYWRIEPQNYRHTTSGAGFICCWVSFTTFTRIPVFFLKLSLAQKCSSIASAFFSKTQQQRDNIVTWSGRDEISCRNKDGT